MDLQSHAFVIFRIATPSRYSSLPAISRSHRQFASRLPELNQLTVPDFRLSGTLRSSYSIQESYRWRSTCFHESLGAHRVPLYINPGYTGLPEMASYRSTRLYASSQLSSKEDQPVYTYVSSTPKCHNLETFATDLDLKITQA